MAVGTVPTRKSGDMDQNGAPKVPIPLRVWRNHDANGGAQTGHKHTVSVAVDVMKEVRGVSAKSKGACALPLLLTDSSEFPGGRS